MIPVIGRAPARGKNPGRPEVRPERPRIMNVFRTKLSSSLPTLLSAVLAFGVSASARAHCDTLDGPVVKEARVALESGDVTPLLKWVRKEDEAEIRTAFQQARAVRGGSPEARALADQYFFETLVRVHRAGEGAPYNGLKPAGSELGPAVAGSDAALEGGSADALVKAVTDQAAAGLRERYQRVAEAKKHAGESVEAGRRYVAAYVEFVHYAERLYDDAARSAGHDHGAAHAETAAGPAPAHDH
jgi:hypothetical protein